MKKVTKQPYFIVFIITLIIAVIALQYPSIAEAAPCKSGQYSTGEGSACEAVNVAHKTWADNFKNYLIEIAMVIALSVKSIALITIIYSGYQYMRIVTDVKSVSAIKGKIIGAFLALFLAVSGELIIKIATEVTI